MPDDPPDDFKKKRDPERTAELTAFDLLELDPPTAEISLLDPDVEQVDEAPPPPPKPGLGKPARPGKSPVSISTLRNAAPPPPRTPSKPPPPGAPSRPPPPGKRASKPPTPAAIAPKAPPPAKPGKLREPKAAPPREPQHSAPPPPMIAEPTLADASSKELLALCEQQLEAKPTPERAARLHYEIGRLYEIDRHDANRAVEHYQAALKHAPDHAAAIRGARRMLGTLGRHAALPPLFDAEIKLTREPAARARLLYAKARVLDDQLRQAPVALAVYREALAIDPGNLTVLKAVERSLRRDKAWPALAEAYAQLAASVEEASLRASWTAQRARLIETELGDAAQAAPLYEAAVETDPHATTALGALKRLASDQHQWLSLIAALRREHDLCSETDARVQILWTIAHIQEQRLREPDSATATLEQAVRVTPEDTALLSELTRLHRRAGRHAAELEVLVRLVELTSDRDTRIEQCHRIGQLDEEHLHDPDRARTWYERAIQEDPGHRPSSLAICALYERADDWAAVVRVLIGRAEAIQAPEERAELHHRIGTLFEHKLGKKEDAIAHHARALGLSPAHDTAFDALTRLLTEAKRWPELAEIYQRATDRAPNDEVAVAWLFRLGALREDRLDDAAGALATYERILERNPQHLGALHAVERVAGRAGQWPRVVEVLRAEAALVTSKDRAKALLHEAATVMADRLADSAGAIRALEEILSKDGQHRASLETLIELLATAGRWDQLGEAVRKLLPLVPSAIEKARLLLRLGSIAETHLGRDAEALEAYRKALELDPELTPAHSALRLLLERTGAWKDLADLLDKELASGTGSTRERARDASELGFLCEEKLGDLDRALAAYEKALEIQPLYRPALDARERLLTGRSAWKELIAQLTSESEGSTDAFLKTHAAFRAAALLAEKQGAVGPALEAFRPVFAARPDHVGALLAVEELYARTRDDAGLAATYEKMADTVGDRGAQLAALWELARARTIIGEDAGPTYRRILQLTPDDSTALEVLVGDAERDQDLGGLLSLQARLAATATDPTVAAFHQTRVGELLALNSDPAGALAAFRAALAFDPRSIAPARGLTMAARALADPTALREAAKHEESVCGDRAVAVSLLLEASHLRRKSQDSAGAAEDLQYALDLDPDDENAADGLRAALVALDRVDRLVELLDRAAHRARKPERVCALHLAVAQLQAESKRDLPAAIAATQRALIARPDDTVALSRLAAYLERNGQWAEAVETLERLIPKAKDELLVDSHLRLARIAEGQLGDPDRAMRSLRAVLARDENRVEAIAVLVRLERGKGRDEEARRLAQKLIQLTSDPVRKAEALSELALIEKARGANAAAAGAAGTALALQGPEGSAAAVYRSMIEIAPEHASWENYANAITNYLERMKSDGGPVSGAYRELARVFGEHHNRPDRAIATLREGVEACPDDPDLSLGLARQLMKLGAHDKALEELRRTLARDVRQARIWRAMADVLRMLGEPAAGAIILSPLIALGEATQDEERTVRSRQVRTAQAPAGILGGSGLKQITDRRAFDSPAVQLIGALSEILTKIEGVELERWGVSKRDRLRAGELHPIRVAADRIGPIFAVPEFDLFICPNGPDTVIIEPGTPPAILVPRRFEGARDAPLAFLLARPLALLSRQLQVLDRLSPDGVRRLLVATVRQFEPSFSLGREDPETENEVRRIGKAIPWLSRGRIQDAATTFAAAPPEDPILWVRDVKRAAARAALLVADDLNGSLEALGEPLGPDNIASDLVRFWVSDPAMRFRRVVAQQL